MFRSRQYEISTEHSLSFTTSSQTRKRKATGNTDVAPQSKKQSRAVDTKEESLPTPILNTPPLTTMDSDDEFMSGASSQEDNFGGTEDSGDELGLGKSVDFW